MEYRLPKTIESLVPYDPIQGSYELRLDANESYIMPTEKHLAALKQKVADIEFNRYPDPCAKSLCEKFAAYYDLDAALVTAFNGSDELLALLCGTFFQPGQKLAVLEHDFSMYRLYAQMYGVECLIIPQAEDLRVDVDDILDFIDANGVSAVLFSNPSNPTSLGIPAGEIKRLIARTEALVILDEAYMDFWDESVLELAGKAKNLLMLKTCSKAIGFAAARLGFAVTTKEFTKILRAVKSPYNVNAISQAFGEVILSDPDFLRDSTKQIIQNRQMLSDGIEGLQQQFPEVITQVFDSKTNFVLLRTTKNKKIWEALLKRSIATRNMDRYLRISTGSREQNERLLSAMKDILSSR